MKDADEVLRYFARRAKARFYADENLPKEAVGILRGMGAKVLTVQEANKRGEPDENHAAYALKKGLVLLTCDRDYLNNRRFPLNQCPAIFLFDFGGGTAREIWRVFRCLGPVFWAPQFYDKWCKVDAKRESWTQSLRFQNGTTAKSKHRLHRGRIEEWVDG
jgi:predicted nuclease of predicted toxin-antitoxin system